MVGKRFREAVRLAQITIGNWKRLDGHYQAQGIDLLHFPLYTLLNVIFVWAAERIASDKVTEWENGLTAPLPGETAEDAAADFDDSFDQINH
ncbi:MAG TPA: hypothetical protein DEP82_14590 [Arthrobacter bacterium]|jgi:hypothetical protein|nr:hypothetical protein [Arthrobacter sp.]